MDRQQKDWQEEINREVKRWDDNWKALMEVDQQARKQGTLKNRIIKHSYADGYAVYKIIRVNKKTVRIRVCTGLGDDWILPAWGEECSISRKQAEAFIDAEDALRDMFAAADKKREASHAG